LKIKSALASLVLVASNSAALATTVTITSISGGSVIGTNEIELARNAQVTVGFRLTNDSDSVYGIGVSAFGYDESLVDFVSGSAVASIFHAYCAIGVGCFGGVSNFHEGTLGESSIGSHGNRVICMDYLSTSAKAANALDPGLDNAIGGGDDQIGLTFEASATNTGTSTITLGTTYLGDAVVLTGGNTTDATPAVLTIHVIP